LLEKNPAISKCSVISVATVSGGGYGKINRFYE
jgi:hypothetical protein